MRRVPLARCIGYLRDAILFWILLPPTAEPDTWHVTYDPDQPENRVGVIAAQAASGDVIEIDPGVYFEHIPLEGKSLRFVGLGGAGTTILDGSRALPEREGSIVYAETGDTGDLTLEGLTLRNGTGVRVAWLQDQYAGGAVYWAGVQDAQTGSLTAVDCNFENNTTGYPENLWAVGGGAILAMHLGAVRIERCAFSNNVTNTRGGDLLLGTSGSALVNDCEFVMGAGGFSGGVSVEKSGWGTLAIRHSVFRSETGGDGGSTGLLLEADAIDLQDNLFIDSGDVLATRVVIDCWSCLGARPADIRVSGNVFWSAVAPDSAASATLLVWWPGASVAVRENTLVRCGVEVSDSEGGGTPLVFENNIVVHGTVFFSAPQGGDYSCNDFWRSRVLGGDNLTYSNNMTANPLFCDETNGDFTLSEGSPCAPPGNAECGLIGAEPVACDLGVYACCVGQGCQLVTEAECGNLGGRWMIDPPFTACDPNPCVVPVVETTWGGIKAMFR
jgi:hypothetical protein